MEYLKINLGVKSFQAISFEVEVASFKNEGGSFHYKDVSFHKRNRLKTNYRAYLKQEQRQQISLRKSSMFSSVIKLFFRIRTMCELIYVNSRRDLKPSTMFNNTSSCKYKSVNTKQTKEKPQVAQAPLGTVNMTLRNSVISERF